jgi:hypothetical protein
MSKHNGRNKNYALATSLRRAFHRFQQANHVNFANDDEIKYYDPINDTPLTTYNSGADGHYLNEQDRIDAGFPILCKSSKRVGVANGGTSKADSVTTLPFDHLSPQARQADTFTDFPQSLMSVGTVSIFTKEGVTVHKEADVLITCKGEPILIGVRDEHGRYCIPLTQHKGQWQPCQPTKQAKAVLQQANSVYDLPSTERAIKWRLSSQINLVESHQGQSWQLCRLASPLLTEQNVKKYYPETTETPKGHLNQSWKNLRSTKPEPFEEVHSNQLRGRKV